MFRGQPDDYAAEAFLHDPGEREGGARGKPVDHWQTTQGRLGQTAASLKKKRKTNKTKNPGKLQVYFLKSPGL